MEVGILEVDRGRPGRKIQRLDDRPECLHRNFFGQIKRLRTQVDNGSPNAWLLLGSQEECRSIPLPQDLAGTRQMAHFSRLELSPRMGVGWRMGWDGGVFVNSREQPRETVAKTHPSEVMLSQAIANS